MLDPLISWLDAARWHFWFVAVAATILWSVTLVIDTPAVSGSDRLSIAWKRWALASVGLLLAWRWPYLVGPAIANPDEAQMIAGAITLRPHPVFWKYVDGTTHGPLADLPLLCAHLFGVPFNYGGARFVGGLLMLGGFIFAGRGLMWLYPPQAVRIGLAPVVLLWASISFYDFTGYTSEQITIFLILASFWPLTAGVVRKELSVASRAVRFGFGGFLVGCLPYAKLQGVLLGLAVGAIALIAILAQRSLRRSSRAKLLGGLVVGALLPSAIVGVYLWIWGLGRQFWVAYILNNITYAGTGFLDWTWVRQNFWRFMDVPPGLQTTTWIVLGFAFAGIALLAWPAPAPRRDPKLNSRRHGSWPRLAPAWGKLSGEGRWFLPVVALLASTSIYTVVAPGRPFHHYLQFLGIPLALAGVVFCGEIWNQLQRFPRRFRMISIAIMVPLVLTPLLVVRHHRAIPEMLGLWTAHRGEWRSPTSLAIIQLARPGDTMSVWGWMPYFYPETGLPHATREAHTYRQIEPFPMRDFYRARYLRDFQRRPPRIFVDAVGGTNFGYGDSRRPDCAHETFAPLRAIIEHDYVFASEVSGSRIYLRK